MEQKYVGLRHLPFIMVLKFENVQEITFIRLKAYYTKNNKSFTEMLIHMALKINIW